MGGPQLQLIYDKVYAEFGAKAILHRRCHPKRLRRSRRDLIRD